MDDDNDDDNAGRHGILGFSTLAFSLDPQIIRCKKDFAHKQNIHSPRLLNPRFLNRSH